jgi:peptide/nickel transport system substrate-binding protein
MPNVSLKYAKWEGYWQKGLPYLDNVEINFVADPVVALTSFRKGEAHVDRGITTKDAAALKKEGYTIDGYIATIMSIAFDSKNPNSPFSNIKVRQAIAYAIDRQTIVNSVYDGMFSPTHQLAAPGAQAYDSSIKGYPYDPDKAKALLGELGYSTAKPLKTKLTYVTDPQRADCFTAVQGYLAKVGIELSLQAIDQGAYNTLNTSGWDGLLEYRFSYNGLEMQYSTSAMGNMANSRLNYKSLYVPPEYDILLATALAENDMNKREEYYKQLNKMAIDDYCLVIPLVVQKTLTSKSPDLIDLGMGQGTSGEYLPERAWLKK